VTPGEEKLAIDQNGRTNMDTIKIAAKRRTGSGKGAARRLRHDELIPAVTYGPEHDSAPLAISPKELLAVLASEHGRNSVIELDVEGEKITALLADYQYHPVSRQLLHADFLQISLERPVLVDVPLELTGKAQGVVLGGTLRQVFRKLPIECLPMNIPVKIEHDVTELGLDDTVSTKDLALPEGVTVRLPAEQTVAAVVTETTRGMEDEEAAPEAAAAAPEGGAPPAAPEA
jgi:large subunit ribosomal protein L25